MMNRRLVSKVSSLFLRECRADSGLRMWALKVGHLLKDRKKREAKGRTPSPLRETWFCGSSSR